MSNARPIKTIAILILLGAVLCLLPAANGFAEEDVASDVTSQQAAEQEEAEKPPVKLGAEHLGKSREALGSDKVVDTQPKPDKVRPRRDGADDDRPRHGKPHGKKHPKMHPDGSRHEHHRMHEDHAECDETCKARHREHKKRRVRDYDACVETSVRAKNDPGESARVCRALFPARDS